jgi:hypothetical protein
MKYSIITIELRQQKVETKTYSTYQLTDLYASHTYVNDRSLLKGPVELSNASIHAK